MRRSFVLKCVISKGNYDAAYIRKIPKAVHYSVPKFKPLPVRGTQTPSGSPRSRLKKETERP
jgi:hypothetical protein